jgi:protein-tyrosine-phosphatase
MKKVLFVCSGNAFRSPVAEALLKMIRSDVKTESAGTNTVIPVSEAANHYLSKIGASKYLKKNTTSVFEKNLVEYDLVVVMENMHKKVILKYCPECKNKIVVWNIDDPYFLPYGNTERIFNLIKKKVEKLATLL